MRPSCGRCRFPPGGGRWPLRGAWKFLLAGLESIESLRNHLLGLELRLVRFAVHGVAAQVLRLDVSQIMPVQIGDGQFAEDVVDDRGRHLDVRVALDHAVRLEAREQERIHELFQRHAMLQPERDGDGETVGHAAEGGPFLVHVEEDLAERAVLVLAGAQIILWLPMRAFCV